MSIETRFDIALIARMALREKQIQQVYRPIIAVHKWFARRPGTLFRGLVLAEFAETPLHDSFFKSHDFKKRMVADPFMGGGTPLLEANRAGCDVQGFDINPMAAWIVREEIEHLDLAAYRQAANALRKALSADLADLYRTDCPIYGDQGVSVKYFLWVKTLDCDACGHGVDLFQGYLLADDTRHTSHVLICPGCGELNEVADPKEAGDCHACTTPLTRSGPARRGRCPCPSCGHVNIFPRKDGNPLGHRLFAIEYHNPERKKDHKGRFFKKPDAADLARFDRAATQWTELESSYVPEQDIPRGDETDRLHRWGYRKYRELFNERQLLGLERSCRLIAAIENERVRQALATNLSDLLRYQNMLCRYDTMALKSLDIFSVHGFPVGLIQCESNLLGISDGKSSIGSGGWSNIVDKYEKAKSYCDAPFEIRMDGKRKIQVPIEDEWIGEHRPGARSRDVAIRCASSATLDLPPESLDAVFTDPPYFGNVQYGELMNFCYVWLRRLVGNEAEGFDRISALDAAELTGNATQARGIAHFTEGLGEVYAAMVRALKPGAPLAFTFHHNKIDAYHAIGVAILDSGLTCSAAIPCPAEMGGSIHIHGTNSSIIDTVFVCRSVFASKLTAPRSLEALEPILADELDQLRNGGVKPSIGDVRCIIFGHVTRMAIQMLRNAWTTDRPTNDKLKQFAETVAGVGDINALVGTLTATPPSDDMETTLVDDEFLRAVSV